MWDWSHGTIRKVEVYGRKIISKAVNEQERGKRKTKGKKRQNLRDAEKTDNVIKAEQEHQEHQLKIWMNNWLHILLFLTKSLQDEQKQKSDQIPKEGNADLQSTRIPRPAT